MYNQIAPILASGATRIAQSDHDVVRRSADFPPGLYSEYFHSFSPDVTDAKVNKAEHERLKEELKHMLQANVANPLQKLELINTIQRLGVDYLFKNEIELILREIYNHSGSNANEDDYNQDLHCVSLKFRLIRQQGYKLSCEVFKKFKDEKGDFKDSLLDDARAMLSFYEAAQLRVHGEDILDEADDFTVTHLTTLASKVSSPLAEEISHALKQCIRRGLPRLEARCYFAIYEQEPSRNEVLLKFAKLDFNMLQKQQRKELSEFVRWWKGLDVPKNFSFTRDRPVECYFWILGVYFEPEYYLARRFLTKVIAMTSILDDIYDLFGTPKELKLLTEAIDRWDICATDKLPEYMKLFYGALLEVYDEMERSMADESLSYRLNYAKEAMKNQVQAYLLESKWLERQYVPTVEEYMSVALTTSGYGMLIVSSFVGMGDIVTEGSFQWLLSQPKIVTASKIVCRLMNDIVSKEFEQKRGHVASGIECYMKQHGATREEAVTEFRKQITNAWKDINEERLYPVAVPMPLLDRILNFARVMDVLYKDDDGYTQSQIVTKDFIAALFFDPAPM